LKRREEGCCNKNVCRKSLNIIHFSEKCEIVDNFLAKLKNLRKFRKYMVEMLLITCG